MLTKGPVGIGIPLLVAGVTAALERRLGALVRECRLVPGVLLAAAVAGPWYALIVARYGGTFTGFFFGQEHLVRFSQPIQGHSGPIIYYLAAAVVLFFPWCGFVP